MEARDFRVRDREASDKDVKAAAVTTASKLTEMLSMMQRQERKGGNPFLVTRA